jgi:hypothetical protein
VVQFPLWAMLIILKKRKGTFLEVSFAYKINIEIYKLVWGLRFRRKKHLDVLIIGLCILLRVYQLNTGRTSIRNKVF